MEIIQSASKIVFILMALATIFLTYVGVVEAKDFNNLALMAFTFYLSHKGNDKKPYAGK